MHAGFGWRRCKACARQGFVGCNNECSQPLQKGTRSSWVGRLQEWNPRCCFRLLLCPLATCVNSVGRISAGGRLPGICELNDLPMPDGSGFSCCSGAPQRITDLVFWIPGHVEQSHPQTRNILFFSKGALSNSEQYPRTFTLHGCAFFQGHDFSGACFRGHLSIKFGHPVGGSTFLGGIAHFSGAWRSFGAPPIPIGRQNLSAAPVEPRVLRGKRQRRCPGRSLNDVT